jgi:hypothetical protein
MTRLRYFAITATFALLAGCSDYSADRLTAPSADIVIQANGTTHVVKTPRQYGDWALSLIQPSGGSLSAGGHTLQVPTGAVSAPTWFLMYVADSDAVQVTLKAWRAIDRAPVTQFNNVPVRLTLDASRRGILDPAGLVVVYLRDGTTSGALEAVPSTVDSSKWTVTGVLTHFSAYALAREYAPGID